MNYNDHRRAKATQNFGLLRWPFLLFLTAVFFLNYHNLTDNYHSLPSSQGQINDLNSSVDNITDAIDQGSVTRRITLLSLGVVAFISVVLYRGSLRLWPNGSLGWLILGFVALAFISPIWAEDLPLTLRRLVVFAIFCIAAVAVASRFSLREIVWWAFCSSALYLLIGILAEVAYGTLRPFEFGYRFAGTLHPNTQGINCVLLLLSALASADMDKRRQTLLRVCALVGLVFLILTASRAACATGAVALTVYLAAVDRRWPKVALALAVGSALGLSLLVARDVTVSESGGLPSSEGMTLRSHLLAAASGSGRTSANTSTNVQFLGMATAHSGLPRALARFLGRKTGQFPTAIRYTSSIFSAWVRWGLACTPYCSSLGSSVPLLFIGSRRIRPSPFMGRSWCFTHWMGFSSAPFSRDRS